MTFAFGFILCLILLNGLFAMAEMALVAAKAHRLRQRIEHGDRGAAKALELLEHPTHFLSTVQIGITAIGILSGALGEEAIARPLLPYLQTIPALQPYADELALVITVVLITYLSLIMGELVPKRLALQHPEDIAAHIAWPMHWLSVLALPAVKMLSLSTDLVLWLLRIKPKKHPSVTEEEITLLLEQGTEEGVFEEAEQQLMENILKLDARKVEAIMTPRKDIVYLDLRKSYEENHRRLLAHDHWILPLCDGGLERVIGVVKTKDLLNHFLAATSPDLKAIAVPALYVLNTLTLMELLKAFKTAQAHMALVVDEYGEIEGLVTLSDVFEAIVGAMPSSTGEDRPEIVRRDDGSWLIDGLVDIDQLKMRFDLDALPEEKSGAFHTVGGFVMHMLGRVPKTADHFRFNDLEIEVVDMNGNRVDKVLVTRVQEKAPPD